MTQPETTTARVRMSADQRRESILRAATKVFAEHGYRRGKVSTIAERLGVSEPVIFQNFGTKAALFRAVLDRLATTANGVLAAAISHGGSVSELLALALSPAHIVELHAPGSLGALFAEASGLTADPDVGEAARRAIQQVADGLADVLTRGQAAGDIGADLDPVAGSWWLLSLLSARAFRTAIAPDPAAIEAELAAMTLHLFTASGGADLP
ncbi:TetR/AcrR family transcriptional regulator [Pengzhenrongella sp.]|uniref:TetR/AcrR family transcriptional regulator n=1 Tax=Pengzhenrongella sp. TaxID=2888820 RepID=UPI002F931037